MSADGNTLAAGAISEDSAAKGINGDQNDNSAQSSGAVYVFTRSGTKWSQQAYVKASNTDPMDLFGYAVGLSADGNTMAVSAYDEDSSAREINGVMDKMRRGSGAIYVFTRTQPRTGRRPLISKLPMLKTGIPWAMTWPLARMAIPS